MKTPITHNEKIELEKKNNVIVKLKRNGKLTGIYPAYRKIARWIGSEDRWDVVYIAAKQYHSLIDDRLKADINYDIMMCMLKDQYIDYAGRPVKIFRLEKDAIKYLEQ